MSHPPRSAPGSHVPPLQRVEEPDAVGRAADLDDVFPGQLQQVRTYRSPSESRESLDPAQSLCAGWQLQAPWLGWLAELTPSPLLPPLPLPGARPGDRGTGQGNTGRAFLYTQRSPQKHFSAGFKEGGATGVTTPVPLSCRWRAR